MPPNPAPGSARPAALVNAEIRELMRGAWGRPLTDEERARYRVLRDEWAAAERRPPGVVAA